MAQLSAQGPIAFAHATTETVTSAAHVVGTRGYDSNGNEYRYVQFTNAVGAGGWVVFDGSWNARRVVSADPLRVVLSVPHYLRPLAWLGVRRVDVFERKRVGGLWVGVTR
ncbi:MAG: hypothetical protein VW362_10725, partial [Candidatus Nanopelagicales bacterium]